MNRITHVAVAALTQAGCLGLPPRPPTTGYGEPYKGTGEGIYVKDSRDDWDITEGHHKITSEQALEASGDQEYEARRQIAKAYNDRLYQEGLHHRRLAFHVMEASGAAIVIGYIAGFVIAPHLQNEADLPAAAGMPEMQHFTSGFAADTMATTGVALLLAGLVGLPYAWYGGHKPPPYHEWRTPGPLDRPAYVRQQTEPYNEKIGAPTVPDAETGTQKDAPPPASELHLPPGVHGPRSRHIPRPRGER